MNCVLNSRFSVVQFLARSGNCEGAKKKKKNVINANFNIELADIQTAQENYKNKFSIPGVVEVEFTVRCDLHGQVPLTSAARPVRFFSFVSNVSMATESHKK